MRGPIGLARPQPCVFPGDPQYTILSAFDPESQEEKVSLWRKSLCDQRGYTLSRVVVQHSWPVTRIEREPDHAPYYTARTACLLQAHRPRRRSTPPSHCTHKAAGPTELLSLHGEEPTPLLSRRMGCRPPHGGRRRRPGHDQACGRCPLGLFSPVRLDCRESQYQRCFPRNNATVIDITSPTCPWVGSAYLWRRGRYCEVCGASIGRGIGMSARTGWRRLRHTSRARSWSWRTYRSATFYRLEIIARRGAKIQDAVAACRKAMPAILI